MFKKFFIHILIFILASIAITLTINIVPSVYYKIGIHNLNQKKYKQAESNFQKALVFKSKNRDYRYNYVKALISQPATLDIQKKVYAMSIDPQNDSARSLAQLKIYEWRNNVMQNIGQNYIEQASNDGGVMRWNIEKSPIKVKLSNMTHRDLPEYFKQEIEKALNQWHNSLPFLQFTYVKNERDANIVISIEDIPNNVCKDNNCLFTVGFTTPSYKGDTLKKMTITLYATNPSGYYFSSTELYNTVLHEMGHALGIMGHSYNSDDLMHMSYDGDNRYTQHRSSFQALSSRDINTVKLLYKLIPDITNAKIKNTKNLIYAPIIVGSPIEIAQRKIKEAKNYIKKAPDIPMGYIDLGIAYASLGKYKDAIKMFKKALSLSKSASDEYISAFNLANVYFSIKDYKNAQNYAQYAKNVSDTQEINLLLFEINSHLK